MSEDPAASSDGGPEATPRLSGDQAIADAEVRAQHTAARNIPVLPDLPIPDDTANLREGPDLNHGVLALIPLVGVWRGEGEGHDSDGDYRFGQQIVVSHDGGNYLAWESKIWRLGLEDTAAEGETTGIAMRESGYWRVDGDGTDEVIELLLTHSTGLVELYYGEALTQSSWELATDVAIRSQSGALLGGAKRLYGIVEGGDLAYVEERVVADGPMEPRLSARLQRYIG